MWHYSPKCACSHSFVRNFKICCTTDDGTPCSDMILLIRGTWMLWGGWNIYYLDCQYPFLSAHLHSHTRHEDKIPIKLTLRIQHENVKLKLITSIKGKTNVQLFGLLFNNNITEHCKVKSQNYCKLDYILFVTAFKHWKILSVWIFFS